MSLKLARCFVTVSDQEEALAFYRDVVGLEVRTDIEIGEMRWLTVAPPSQADGPELSLETPEGRPGSGEALREVIAAGSLTAAIFKTDDSDALFAKARASGAQVIQEPKDQPYGVRDCAVRDPFRNMMRFAQPLGA